MNWNAYTDAIRVQRAMLVWRQLTRELSDDIVKQGRTQSSMLEYPIRSLRSRFFASVACTIILQHWRNSESKLSVHLYTPSFRCSCQTRARLALWKSPAYIVRTGPQVIFPGCHSSSANVTRSNTLSMELGHLRRLAISSGSIPKDFLLVHLIIFSA